MANPFGTLPDTTRDTTLDIVAAMLAEAEHDRLRARAAAESVVSNKLRIVWYLATNERIVDEAIERVQSLISVQQIEADPSRAVDRAVRCFYRVWIDAIVVAAATAGRVGEQR